MASIQASTIQVSERTISYRRLGNGKRKILFFHGFPGSSAQVLPFTEHLQNFNAEILCLDRPGYNKTTIGDLEPFQQASWDTLSLVKEFNWHEFELVSVSGGTPYLFAFLNHAPSAVKKISIVSGLGPIMAKEFKNILHWKSQQSLRLIPYTPELIFFWLLKNAKYLRVFLKPSHADLQVLKNIENTKVLETALHEGFHQNGLGPKQDAKAYLSLWSIPLHKLPQNVQIWHGADDEIIPVKMASGFAQMIPQAQLNILENEGHYSVAFKYINQILATGTELV